jgi:hypothetical protein
MRGSYVGSRCTFHDAARTTPHDSTRLLNMRSVSLPPRGALPRNAVSPPARICASMNPAWAREFLQEIYRRFCQESKQSGATEANIALYANLAKPYFARFYAKLLIPRLGT